jgi:hypothetical protein
MNTGRRVIVGVVLAVAGWSGARGQVQGDGSEWEYAAQARYVSADLQCLERAYLYSLECPNEGVVACALREVARVKITHLYWESEKLEQKVADIMQDGCTPAVRYAASLVYALFETPALFAPEAGTDFRTPGRLYRALARRLESNLLAGHSG